VGNKAAVQGYQAFFTGDETEALCETGVLQPPILHWGLPQSSSHDLTSIRVLYSLVDILSIEQVEFAYLVGICEKGGDELCTTSSEEFPGVGDSVVPRRALAS
jgi:hypothetical protein